MIDVLTPQSPGWWLNRLILRLSEGQARYNLLERHYVGDAHLPQLTNRQVRDAYLRLSAVARTNYAELVVEALRERMKPISFRTGADGDDLGDKEAWRIWQANDMDIGSILVHRGKLAMADSYVIVGPVDPETGAPLITVEDPREVITEQDPARPRHTVAALKVFRDDAAGLDRAYLYLPGYVIHATRKTTSGVLDLSSRGWEWDGDPAPLPTQTVPVVRFGNRVDHHGRAWGEFETHIPLLDRINYGVLQRLEIVTLQAFRQRAIKSDSLPSVDENGDEIDYDDLFAADPGALWRLPATADLWESGTVDLSPIQNSIEDDTKALAAVTRTPLFYLTPDATNGSAEGAALAREGLVFKARDRIAETRDPWGRVMSLAFEFAGDPVRASRKDMRVDFADPERFSLSIRADAAAKAIVGGMTWRSTMEEIWQFPPDVIARMESERAADQLLGLSAVPQAEAKPKTVRLPVNEATPTAPPAGA